MSAELLREAADRLDALADDAAPGPWSTDETRQYWAVRSVSRGGLVVRTASLSSPDAAYIAAMSPAVGKALAAWLRAEADNCTRYDGEVLPWHPAIAVARAVLGRDS